MDNSRDILIRYYSYVARLVVRSVVEYILPPSAIENIDDGSHEENIPSYTISITHNSGGRGPNGPNNNTPSVTTFTRRSRNPKFLHTSSSPRRDATPRDYFLRKTRRSRDARVKDVRDMPRASHGTRVGGQRADNSEILAFARQARLDRYRREEAERAAVQRELDRQYHVAWTRENAPMLLEQRLQIHEHMRVERRERRRRVRVMVRGQRERMVRERERWNKERLRQMPNRILKVARPDYWFRDNNLDSPAAWYWFDDEEEEEPRRPPRRRNRQKRRRKAAKARRIAAEGGE